MGGGWRRLADPLQLILQLICSRSTRSNFPCCVGRLLIVCGVSDCSMHLLAQLGCRRFYTVVIIGIQQLFFSHFDFLFDCFYALLGGRGRAFHIRQLLIIH